MVACLLSCWLPPRVKDSSDFVRGKKILLIDDDLDTHEIITRTFSRSGAQVVSARNGKQGLSLLYSHRPDLVLVDVLLPEIDGWGLCRKIRLFSDVPIIILTAVHGENLEVRSLDEGATDFITKPFNTRILLARAKAAIRKVRQAASIEVQVVFRDHYLHIDIAKNIVLVQGQPVRLSTIERRLLAYLISHTGRVVTRQQILEFVWPGKMHASNANLHVYASRLRSKLEKNPKKPEYLHTIRGLGYLFTPLR